MKWQDGRTVKSVLDPTPPNMTPKAHVTHKGKDCKVERNTVGFVKRDKEVVVVHVAEVGVMTTGKGDGTTSHYAIVCTGAHVPGPGPVRGYDGACVVDALAFQNWRDRPKMRSATQGEIEATASHLATLAANIAATKSKQASRPRNTKTAASCVFDKVKPWMPLTPEEATRPSSRPVTPPFDTAAAAAFPIMPLLPGSVTFKGMSLAAPGSTSASSSASLMLTSDPCMPTPHGNHQALRALQGMVPAGHPTMSFATAAIMAQQETARMQAKLEAAAELTGARLTAAALEATLLAQAESWKKVETIRKEYDEERKWKEEHDRKVQASILASALSTKREGKRKRRLSAESESEASSTDSSSSSTSTESDDDSDDAEELARALAKVKEEFEKKRSRKTKKKSKKKSKTKNKKGKKSKRV